jgi:hypothetical protein
VALSGVAITPFRRMHPSYAVFFATRLLIRRRSALCTLPALFGSAASATSAREQVDCTASSSHREKCRPFPFFLCVDALLIRHV